MTLLPDPPPSLLLTSHFVNLLKISNYVPKARAKYSSLLTKCIANMLELHLFFASFPFCCIRMKLLTSRPRPPPPPKCHYDIKRTNHSLEMPPKHTHTLSLSHIHTHTHSLSLSYTHTHTHTHTHIHNTNTHTRLCPRSVWPDEVCTGKTSILHSS